MTGKTRTLVSESNCSRICIDAHHLGEVSGRIYHVFQDQPIQFHGMISLVKEINQFLDTYDFPQAGMQLRSFSTKDSKKEVGNEEASNKARATVTPVFREVIRGDLATFHLRILFRQNATWQGTIRWKEGNQEERFRSVLELMMLMDSCLTKESCQLSEDSQLEQTVV